MHLLDLAPPPPPADDPSRGHVSWRTWEPQPACTHLDPSCELCDFPGPLSAAHGLSWDRAERRHLVTHYAVHCPRCRRIEVYRTGGTERFVRVPAMCQAAVTEAAVPETDALVLF